MSATAWSICPRCIVKAKAEYEAKKEAAKAAYGTIPADEWQVLHDQANKPFDEDNYSTLREDYEMYIIEETGLFKCGYSAGCGVCGFEFDYDHEEQTNP